MRRTQRTSSERSSPKRRATLSKSRRQKANSTISVSAASTRRITAQARALSRSLLKLHGRSDVVKIFNVSGSTYIRVLKGGIIERSFYCGLSDEPSTPLAIVGFTMTALIASSPKLLPGFLSLRSHSLHSLVLWLLKMRVWRGAERDFL